MMHQINLSKIKKCNQVWEEMTPNENGRICAKCSKTIIDFRELSDKEVAEVHMFSSEPVCGIYTKRQLEVPSKKGVEKKPLKWASLYVGLGGLLFSNPLTGQEAMDTVKVIQTEQNYDDLEEQPYPTELTKRPEIKDSIIITGKLSDDQDQPLAGAIVVIENTQIGVITDWDGNYSINITEQLDSMNNITLEFAYTGYSRYRIEGITKEGTQKKEARILNVKMAGEAMMITAFGVERAPLHKRIWYKIRSIFRKKNK